MAYFVVKQIVRNDNFNKFDRSKTSILDSHHLFSPGFVKGEEFCFRYCEFYFS